MPQNPSYHDNSALPFHHLGSSDIQDRVLLATLHTPYPRSLPLPGSLTRWERDNFPGFSLRCKGSERGGRVVVVVLVLVEDNDGQEEERLEASINYRA